MSELVLCERQDLVDIADAVRSKTGSSEAMSLNQIAEEVDNMSDAGADVNVTAENIVSALGYTPADEDDLEQLSEEISDKVTSPDVAKVGQVIAVKAVDENGKPVEWETVDMLTGGSSSGGRVLLYPIICGDEYGLCETLDDWMSGTNLITRTRLQELVAEHHTICIYTASTGDGNGFYCAVAILALSPIGGGALGGLSYAKVLTFDGSDLQAYYTAEYFE